MSTASFRLVAKLPWPLPALFAWSGAWAMWHLAQAWGITASGAVLLGVLVGAALALAVDRPWRRALCAVGFPISAWAQGAAAAWPAWAWPLLLFALLLAYPLRAWRDAPFFPTPAHALRGLEQSLAAPRRVLDAGCGLGHGMRALRGLWPQAVIRGVEWSPLLAWLSRRLCPWAQVQRGDMWAMSWSGQDLVYVFQRPESMLRVWVKACADMAPGAYLVSLEFPVPGHKPLHCLERAGQRPVWIYRVEAAKPSSITPAAGR
jgi:hypothetical protein